MTTEIKFYAIRQDLLIVLQLIESKGPIKYTLAGLFSSPEIQDWSSSTAMTDLGKAAGPQTSDCRRYLISNADLQVRPRVINLINGTVRFAVDQLATPDSIIFTAGGKWDEIIVAGKFATVHSTPAAQVLMRRANFAVRRSFTKVQRFWVGPEALGELRAGVRLTQAKQSPEWADLREQESQS